LLKFSVDGVDGRSEAVRVGFATTRLDSPQPYHSAGAECGSGRIGISGSRATQDSKLGVVGV
jgi:hypothetical protein